MSNTQYAVCHLQRGSGNDSGMSCHIERKDAKGKKYVPDNADAGRTHLNRELVRFPEGVSNRTEAIQHRIDTAGLRRKVGKNQTKAIRIILTGTHEQMMKIANGGRLDSWIDANLKWLRETFGNENLVSCVLHMDEKTPHLHATVVPIVAGERVRRKREGERKYETKSGPRLSADDVMRRTKLHEYQNSYAEAMKPFGLQRGIAFQKAFAVSERSNVQKGGNALTEVGIGGASSETAGSDLAAEHEHRHLLAGVVGSFEEVEKIVDEIRGYLHQTGKQAADKGRQPMETSVHCR